MLDYWNHNFLDADQSRVRLGGVLRSHRLQVMQSGRKFRAKISYLGDSRMSMTRLSYGAAVCIEPRPEPGFWIISLPISGSVRVSHSSRDIHSRPGIASMISSSSPVAGYWQEGAEQAVFRLNGSLLQEAALTLGMSTNDLSSCQPVAFPLGANLGLLPACLDSLIKFNVADMTLVSQSLLEKQWQMLSMLIAQAALNHQLTCNYQEQPILNRLATVKILDAQAWIDQMLVREEAVDVNALAQHMGLATRSLQIMMQKNHNMTAHQFIQSRKLIYARQLLRTTKATVAEAALTAGFNHFGRFAKTYAYLFGTSPKHDKEH